MSAVRRTDRFHQSAPAVEEPDTPEQAAEDRDVDWGDPEDDQDHDAMLRREIPPHHGS